MAATANRHSNSKIPPDRHKNLAADGCTSCGRRLHTFNVTTKDRRAHLQALNNFSDEQHTAAFFISGDFEDC